MSLKKAGLVGLLAAAALAIPASAATVEDLQAQVNALLAQLAALQGGSSSSAGCYSFTTDLTIGSTGADVTALQSFLESKGYFTYAGAKGYFGAITQAAVAAWQSANGVMPAAGYFGAISRAKYNTMCGGTSMSDDDDDDMGGLEGGAGSITVEDSNEYGSEEVEEGEEEAGVLAIKVEADDESDVEITSIKVEFENQSAGADSEDFDDYAESVQVMFGGDVVGEADVEDFSENSDVWTKSISLDGVIIRAGEEEEISVMVTALNTIDSEDTDTDDWQADVINVRFEDGEGVITTENTDTDTLEQSFDFVQEGDGEDLNLKSSSNDPDATTFLVDEDDKSDWFEVFAFRIEAEESDVDLEDLVLTVTTSETEYENIVSDVAIEIDGEEFDDYTVADEDTTTADLTFDIDSDYTIDADDTVEVVVKMEFLRALAYTSGTTTVQVQTVSVSGEGADDLTDTATVTGEEHTLSTAPATISNISWVKSESDLTGTLDFFFTVSADEDDVDVFGLGIIDDVTGGTFDAVAATSTTVAQSTSGDGSVTRVSGDDVTAITADGDNGFRVAEGDTVRFRVRYTSTTSGSHEAIITEVAGQAVPDDDQLSPTLVLD